MEHAGLKILWISHHLTKLTVRANLEGLTPAELVRIDQQERPINCGVTIYRGVAATNELVLSEYNRKLY